MTMDWDDHPEEAPWERVLKVDKLGANQLRVARIGIRQVVVAEAQGRYYVFRNACPHAGAPLSGGTYREGMIECPRHRWKFDVRSGACPEHPIYALRTYETKVEEGWIYAREAEAEIW